jgi:hypothetical protein
MSAPITVASYYFPNYHPDDPRNRQFKGAGWSEWELVKAARPRFPGHRQPNVPLWGYTNEADPAAMVQKIDAAADHGVGAFIFDWYYYEDGPFLHRCLDEGYLGAPNNHRVKFGLMWANHDWTDIHPYTRKTPYQLLYPGVVSPAAFERITTEVTERYFAHPSYWRIDGRPYFSFYDLSKLLENFGSLAATRAALDRWRARVPGNIHLNAVVWGQTILPGEKEPVDAVRIVRELGFDSVTSYVWIHHVGLPAMQTDFNHVRDRYFMHWDKSVTLYGVPYYPNATMGWDSSPRARQEDPFDASGYPFMHTISGNTPARFRKALTLMRDRMLAGPANARVLTVNCWNEWTEGSYLEPDTVNGMAYLEAIREVFTGQ